MSATTPSSVEALLTEATSLTRKYDWKTASELCQRALETATSGREKQLIPSIRELLGKSYFRHAMQSESREIFCDRMRYAVSEYEKLTSLYREISSQAFSKRSEAHAYFASYWITVDASERRNLLEKCIALATESAEGFEKGNDVKELAEVHKDLLNYLMEASYLAREAGTLNDIYHRGVALGKQTIAEFKAMQAEEGLLEVLGITIQWTAFFTGLGVIRPEEHEREKIFLLKVSENIGEISQRVKNPEAASRQKYAASLYSEEFQGNIVEALNLAESAVSSSKSTGDALLMGRCFELVGSNSKGAAVLSEDVEVMRKLFDKGIESHSKAIKILEIPLDGASLANCYGQLAESLQFRATLVETNVEAKRAQLSKAIEIARRGMAYQNYTFYGGSSHDISKCLYFLATLESDLGEKKTLLEESLQVREEYVRSIGPIIPRSWFAGVQWNYLALVKAELAKIASDPKAGIQLLQGAVEDMKSCIQICKGFAVSRPTLLSVTWYEEWYGDILLQLYHLNAEKTYPQEAIWTYQDAITRLERLGIFGPIPTIRWKTAKVQDMTGELSAAADAFKDAAADYRIAAQKIPGLRISFESLASYMDAWASIEQARLHHRDEEYSAASSNYATAAEKLQSVKMWNHLSKHYFACSLLEHAEALSREENPKASYESFLTSTASFQKAEKELSSKMETSSDSDDQAELKQWLSLTKERGRYVKGRAELEEAKILDRNGAKEASSKKYHSASQVFRTLLQESTDKQYRDELTTLELFCEAWARMKEAETSASPELYQEASKIFIKAREAAGKETGLQALANASLCKALETGTRFRLTRDPQLYGEIKRQLETAGDYYQEAGLNSAADWTRATQRLFDALVYLADAEVERQREKKAELFHLAEKHLELAARLYEGAGYANKKAETLKYLERAREEKELLLTPIEALRENPAASGGSVTPVSLDRDQAQGLERFEEASIVGNLSVPRSEVTVGSDLMVELEIANLGKTTATLIKMENLAPDGLELDREKSHAHVEENFVNMKGKRLEYLKTDAVKIALKATRKGAYLLKPRVLFVDEKGRYKSYDFEPASLTVTELGISGWIKGSGK